MHSRPGPRLRPIHIAFAISLFLHALLLFTRITQPLWLTPRAPSPADKRLKITLAPPPQPRALPQPPQPEPPPPVEPRQPREKVRKPAVLTRKQAPRAMPAQPAPPPETAAAREFLDELYPPAPPPPPPPSGLELAQRALSMADTVARDLKATEAFRQQRNAHAMENVDPYSMEMYFDAFIRKLNRSAALQRQNREPRGQYIAVVEVSLNADGTLKSYKVINAGDQQAEIEHIRSIVERAAPFSAFPPEVRKHTDSLSFDICILPRHLEAQSAGMFSRTFGGRDCQDLG